MTPALAPGGAWIFHWTMSQVRERIGAAVTHTAFTTGIGVGVAPLRPGRS